MSRKKPFNAMVAIETARSFHTAACVLEAVTAAVRSGARIIGLSGELHKQYVGAKVVPVVLRALAVELLLKARLNSANVSFGNAHNHATLFAKLPNTEKQTLEDRYAKGRDRYLKSETLEAALERSGDAFVNWRYWYEQTSIEASIGEMQLAYNVLADGL